MTVVDAPVTVRDNGVRSFVPPTFCFELHDAVDDHLVDTVSALLITTPSLQFGFRDFEVIAFLQQHKLHALGTISSYDAGPPANELGKQFSIDRCVNSP